MRKTITGTGGMLLLQTLKDAGVEYLFTNPGSAETGLFAAIAEDGDNRLVVGKHEGLVAAMADGYHRVSGKVGVVIAHVMGGSYQLAGPALQRPGGRLVLAGDRGRLGLRAAGLPRPRPVPRAEPGGVDAAHHQGGALRLPGAHESESHQRGHDPRAARGHHAAHRAGVPLDQRGAAAHRRARGDRRRGRELPDRAAGAGAGEDRRGHRQAARRGALPGADVRRRRVARGRAGRGGAAGRGAGGAGVREPADLPELPDAASALLRQLPGVEGLHQDHRARAGPDLPGGLPGRARQRERARHHADRAEPAPDGPALPARPGRAVRAARDPQGHHPGARPRGRRRQRAEAALQGARVRGDADRAGGAARARARARHAGAPRGAGGAPGERAAEEHGDGAGELDRAHRADGVRPRRHGLDAQRRRLARLRGRRRYRRKDSGAT